MRKLIAVCVTLVLLLTLTACDDSQYRKASKAAATIATSLQTMQEVNASLYAQGVLDKQETVALAQAISDSTLANDQFVAKIRTLRELEGNRRLISEWVNDLSANIESLNQKGILHIKNPQAKAKLSLTIAAIRSAIQVIEVAAQ